jgi:photosystem II stability/assembly factor-like uncharacterized protein
VVAALLASFFINGCGDDDSHSRPQPTVTPVPSVPFATPTPAAPLAFAMASVDSETSVLIRSDDGGASWALARTFSDGELYVDFVDRMHGIVASFVGTFMSTSDGGATWQRADVDVSGGGLLDLELATTQNAVAGGIEQIGAGGVRGPSVIFVTTDGGAHWSAATIVSDQRGLAQHIEAVCFTGDGTAFAAGSGGLFPSFGSNPVKQPSFVLRSADHGATWTDISSNLSIPIAEFHQAIACSGADDVWIAGTDGYLLVHSSDGGVTWTDLSSGLTGLTHSVTRVTFVDDQNGWAVASADDFTSLVLRTTDGGITWSPQTIPSGASIFRIAFVDVSHGVATGSLPGNVPLILSTADGGGTWTAASLPTGVQVVGDVAIVP